MPGLLSAFPEDRLGAKATESSPTVAQQFAHFHHERLVSVFENAPEVALPIPEQEWADDRNIARLVGMLEDSAKVVRDAVEGRLLSGRDLELDYDHPVLLLQLLLWHEAYHHGQIKLALKLSGCPIRDEEARPVTWDVWRNRKGANSG